MISPGRRTERPTDTLVTSAVAAILARPQRLPVGLAALDRTLVMGILNVTSDSFSDGGRWLNPAVALARGEYLMAAGADLVDVGGESTRPDAIRISAELEAARVLPVISALARQGIAVSVDTMRAEVAREAVTAGAVLVNDVSGGLADPAMHATVAQLGVPYVAMHWRASAAGMSHEAHYIDVAAEVCSELEQRASEALAAGIDPTVLVLDPGLGFAKDAADNWTLFAAWAQLAELGYPLLVGASRKRFLGGLLAAPDGKPRDVDRREDATTAVTALAAAAGAWCVRVHEPGPSADAVRVAAAWRSGKVTR